MIYSPEEVNQTWKLLRGIEIAANTFQILSSVSSGY